MHNNNGTGNNSVEGAIALGSGCIALTKGQVVLGSYPEITADSSNYGFIVGSGTPYRPFTSLKIKWDGEVLQGGNEVYMISPDTGDIIPVYMQGLDNRLKKVIMK